MSALEKIAEGIAIAVLRMVEDKVTSPEEGKQVSARVAEMLQNDRDRLRLHAQAMLDKRHREGH